MLRNLFTNISKSYIRMQTTPQLAIVYVTASTEDQASRIATGLLQAKLAACVNLVKGVSSVYTWEGKTTHDTETLLIVKSRASLLKKIEGKVKELHSYKVPEVIAVPVLGGSEDYLSWVRENTLDQ